MRKSLLVALAIARFEYASFPFAAILCACLLLFAPMDVGAGEGKKNALAKFEAIGGKVRGDANGNVKLLFYFSTGKAKSDSKLSKIDYGAIGSVEHLFLVAPHLTDESLRQFSKLRDLVAVDIIHTQISDRGLVQFIKNFESLVMINLSKSDITDASLVEIGKLRDLRILTLSELKISDNGIRHIVGLDVGKLDLTHMPLTNNALPILAKLTKLKELSLNGTNVSDDGLFQLANFPSLRRVDLRGTKVTAKGIVALRSANSNLLIVAD